jgi:hypothetical protein
MNRMQTVVATLVIASMSSVAFIERPQAADDKSKAAKFRDLEATMQQESSNEPVLPRVDRTLPSADPVPKATTKAQKKARFIAQERAMQDASTNMPPSLPVDRAARSADPVPIATSKSAKKQRFIEQEKTMQEESTP